MGLTWRPTPPSDEQSFKAMRAALASGCNFWNGGEFYAGSQGNSLTLLKKYFEKYPEDADKVVLSIKGGLKDMKPDGSPENTRRSIDQCIKDIGGTKKIDIFECARVDPDTPIDITLKVIEEEYVKTGKIGGISLSEVSAATIHKAVKITKIVAVEVEFSLWALDVLSNGVAAACAEHNIPLVAYSPIGRGFLSGQIKSYKDIPEGDFRQTLPRMQPDVFDINLKLVDELQKVAKAKGCTPAQLAINWVKSQSKKSGNPEIIPIPGASTEERVKENAKDITLDKTTLDEIDAILGQNKIIGARYGVHGSAYLEG